MPNPLVTTDATPTALMKWRPPKAADNNPVAFNLNLTAVSGSVCAAWVLRSTAKAVSGAVSLVGSLATLSSQKDGGAAAWAVAVSVGSDVIGDFVYLQVTGAVATTITWALQGGRQFMTGNAFPPAVWTEEA